MKKLLLLTTLSASMLSFAQNNQAYVEIAVEESIEINVESVEVNFFVQSHYVQMEEARERLFYYEDLYGYEDDYYYEYLLEESPKEITKEMKKEYEARQKEREERREQLDREMAEFEANFEMFTVSDLMKVLDQEGVKYELILDYESQDEYYDYYDYENKDSVLRVVVTNADEYRKLEDIGDNNPAVVTRDGNVVNESIDGFYEELLPKLAEKAKSQGNIIAKAWAKTGATDFLLKHPSSI